jgi:hypothetical protein
MPLHRRRSDRARTAPPDRAVDHRRVDAEEDEEFAFPEDEVDGLQDLHDLVIRAAVEVVDEDDDTWSVPASSETSDHEAQVIQNDVLVAHPVVVVRSPNVRQHTFAQGLENAPRAGEDDPGHRQYGARTRQERTEDLDERLRPELPGQPIAQPRNTYGTENAEDSGGERWYQKPKHKLGSPIAKGMGKGRKSRRQRGSVASRRPVIVLASPAQICVESSYRQALNWTLRTSPAAAARIARHRRSRPRRWRSRPRRRRRAVASSVVSSNVRDASRTASSSLGNTAEEASCRIRLRVSVGSDPKGPHGTVKGRIVSARIALRMRGVTRRLLAGASHTSASSMKPMNDDLPIPQGP